ncbi:MAG: molybdenum cofactor guanylyltransferase [Planctomycetota bacterium]
MTRAYILAGGRSRRFGSDKALAERDGRPMLRRVADQAMNAGLAVTVVAETAGKYVELDLPTIADDRPHLGPLGGLATALADADGEAEIVLLACDQPSVGPWLERLLDAASADAVAFGAEPPALVHPMPARYATALLPEVRALLTGAKPPGPQRLLADLHDAGRLRVLPAPGTLVDVNRPPTQ